MKYPQLPYNLDRPDKTYTLPGELREISGITWLDDKHIAGVQDEDGYIFVLRLKDGKVVDKVKFEKDGDYEDITKAKKKLYILRSDGTLFKVKDWDSKEQHTKKYKTHLDESNDTEGLCYDPLEHRLLVACKDDPGESKKLKHHRAIYAFDLKEKKLKNKPVLKINLKELQAIAREQNTFLGKFDFMPSGIAIHPLTGDIYVIAASGKLLVIMDREGTIRTAIRLSEFLFPQPEGITFTDSGDLLISNEGRLGNANILLFKPVP